MMIGTTLPFHFDLVMSYFFFGFTNPEITNLFKRLTKENDTSVTFFISPNSYSLFICRSLKLHAGWSKDFSSHFAKEGRICFDFWGQLAPNSYILINRRFPWY